MPSDQFSAARRRMVEELRRQIADERVLDAFGRVPRELFVAPELQDQAYGDWPLPIGHGQTISQPLMVAIMLEALCLTGAERVLDIGTGSGYQAAMIAELAREVVTVELIPEFGAAAAELLARLQYTNVEAHIAGPELGWPEGAPYDAIVVAAAAPEVPASLVDQLAPNGRLVLPVGGRDEQTLMVVRRTESGVSTANRGSCRFVPLIGKGAFGGPGS